MAIKFGTFTTYCNNEYRISRIDGHYEIITNNPNSLDLGFIEYQPEENLNPRIFFKTVSPEEVGDVYEIRTYCLYQGYEFHVVREKNGYYTLETNSTIGMRLIEQLGFERIDKYGYEKTVAKEDLDLIYEKKKLLENYFK